MAALKPAYLIHGEDHGGVAERRASLKALADQQGGAGAVEILSGDEATPGQVAAALATTMTFAIGQRVIIVDGTERWKQAEVQRHLTPAMEQMPPDTTLALFAREEARAKAPAALHAAVKAAGGQVVAHATVKPWELPGWVRTQAARIGLSLDVAAAKALVALVGERQQRLLRELEKIALEMEQPESGGKQAIEVDVDAIESRASRSSQQRAYTLADAVVGGDVKASLATYLALEGQGERLPSLSYQIASRLREALAVSKRLANGESSKDLARSLRMPARAANRFVADVSGADPQRLSEGLASLADVEVDLRGGARILAARRPAAALSERTVALLAIRFIAE